MEYYLLSGFVLGLLYWRSVDFDAVVGAILMSWLFPILLIGEMAEHIYNYYK